MDPGVAASPHEQGQVCVGLWDLKLLAVAVLDMDTKSWENAALFRTTLCKSQAQMKKVTKSAVIMKTNWKVLLARLIKCLDEL